MVRRTILRYPVFEAYNALQTEAHINLNVIDYDYDEKIELYLESPGEVTVDLLGLRGISQVIQYKQNGFILDLTDYLENSDIDVTAYGSMFNDITHNGRYYGMPTRSTCWEKPYSKLNYLINTFILPLVIS